MFDVIFQHIQDKCGCKNQKERGGYRGLLLVTIDFDVFGCTFLSLSCTTWLRARIDDFNLQSNSNYRLGSLASRSSVSLSMFLAVRPFGLP